MGPLKSGCPVCAERWTCFLRNFRTPRPDRVAPNGRVWWESSSNLNVSPPLSISVAANGSSVNMANIITALGNALKDLSGAASTNDSLAAVLI
jgi:hypothetical protein